MKVLAPAKINLYLEIGKKRKDGYHHLNTIFQTVSLYDEIEISTAKEGKNLSLKVSPNSFRKICPENSKNLVWRAAELFLKKFLIKNSCRISLKKKIPLQAGLGGGSSDAACVLKTLSYIYPQAKLPVLSQLASSLGADVPFFLLGGCALASGIGEKIVPLPPLPKFWCVIVKPSLGVSTAQAYRWYDQDQMKTGRQVPHLSGNSLVKKPLVFPRIRLSAGAGLTSQKNLNKILYLIRQKKPAQDWSRYLYNGFESSVYQRVPMLAQIKEKLIRAGAFNACLSGTGSSLFGIVSSKIAGEKIKKKLKGPGREIWVVHSV